LALSFLLLSHFFIVLSNDIIIIIHPPITTKIKQMHDENL
jgi:hypothetical protein